MSRNDTLEPSKKSRPSEMKNCWPSRYEIERGRHDWREERREKEKKGKIFISLEICDFLPYNFSIHVLIL
jgi:hypothetical protein